MKRLQAGVGFVLLLGVLGASGALIQSRFAATPLFASVTGRREVRAPQYATTASVAGPTAPLASTGASDTMQSPGR